MINVCGNFMFINSGIFYLDLAVQEGNDVDVYVIEV